jgi:hypothetical protein
MKTVAVFLADEMTLRRLVLGFRNRCTVRAFPTVESIRSLVAEGRMIATIVDMGPVRNFVCEAVRYCCGATRPG